MAYRKSKTRRVSQSASAINNSDNGEENIVMVVQKIDPEISCFPKENPGEPETYYRKPGEMFYRPNWHRWVYGGEKNPLN